MSGDQSRRWHLPGLRSTRLLGSAETPTASSEPWRDLPRAAQRFVVLVWLFAAALLVVSVLRADWSHVPLARVAVFLVAMPISSIFATELAKQGEHRVLVSTEAAWQIALALIFPPSVATVVTALGDVTGETVSQKPWYKKLFNVSNAIISVAATSAVFHFSSNFGDQLWFVLTAVVISGELHYVTNTVLLGTIMSLVTTRSLKYIWRISFGTVIVHQLAIIFMAGLMALLWKDYPFSLILMIVPLMGVQVSMQQVAKLKKQFGSSLLLDLANSPSIASASNPLRLYGMDHGRIVFDDMLVGSAKLKSPSAREILFYLAEHVEGTTLDRICADVWPDSHADQVRNRFHTSLYRLRRATHQDVVVHVDGIYKVNPVGLWYDAAEFRRALQKATDVPEEPQKIALLADAIAFHRTDYLPQVYSDWAQNVRLLLLEQYLDAAWRLSRLYLDSGQPQKAERVALTALEKDPQQEWLYEVLMLVELASRGPAGAERWYRRCCDALSEVGLKPSESARMLYQEQVLPFLSTKGYNGDQDRRPSPA